MPDPDLVFRAQLAAGALEEAWRRWRSAHGLTADPGPAVSSYVGYSIEEPWGQPRVVFGLGAQDAEQLTALLERHECVGPVYAAVATSSVAREPQAWAAARSAPLPVPRQGQATADGRSMTSANGDYNEPVFRQAAAAIQEAAAARGGPAVDPTAPDDGGPVGQDPADGATPMGELTRAASAARAAAEARIKAARTDHGHETVPGDPPVPDAADDTGPGPNGVPAPQAAVPVQATDVLEPLPTPEPSGAYTTPDEEEEESAAGPEQSEMSADGGPDSSASGTTRRGRGSRGYSMPKISRAKRPGAVPEV